MMMMVMVMSAVRPSSMDLEWDGICGFFFFFFSLVFV